MFTRVLIGIHGIVSLHTAERAPCSKRQRGVTAEMWQSYSDVFYTADSSFAGGVSGGGTGLCMPKDIEVVDLKLHVACIPDQVHLCMGM